MPAPRYLCIHGHFYQPPRENPWLGAVEVQDSAAPYHDWNERVTQECYAPNTRARLLDGSGRIINLIKQLCLDQLQFWSHAAAMDGRSGTGGAGGNGRGRPPQPGSARGARQRAGTGL